MYLSIKQNFNLDEIIKSFEVGYRGHIANQLKIKYPTLNQFSIAINKVYTSLDHSPVIFSKKLKARAKKIKQEVATYYSKVEDSYQAYKTNTYQREVPYLAEINDYVFLLFDDCFKSL